MATNHVPDTPLPSLGLGPYYSDSHIRGARYQIITPSGEPFVARIVAEVPDLDTARAIISRANAYPQLVEALRIACGVDVTSDSFNNDRQRCKALLRDLGEL